jgi:hypothetical protein
VMLRQSRELWQRCEDMRQRSRELRAQGLRLQRPVVTMQGAARNGALVNGVQERQRAAAGLDQAERDLQVALQDVRRERERLAEQIRRLEKRAAQTPAKGPGEVLTFPARPKPD